MSVFEYRAYDSSGKTVAGIVDAENLSIARAKLRKQGIFATELKEDTKRKSFARDISIARLFERVRPVDVSLMTRQLATLLKAGLPLVQSLSAIIDQVKNNPMKKVVSRLRERVNEGSTLADALSEHPKVFSPLFVNMTRAGEASGALEIVLLRLADFTENQIQLKNRMWATFSYPILMVFVGSGVLFFLMTYVVPTVVKIFKDMEQSLPLPTVILISISSFLRDYWWLLLLFFIAVAFVLKRYIKTKKGRMLLDRIKIEMPVMGSLYRKIAISRFTRTLALLLNSGVPVLLSLDIVKAVVNNVVLASAVESARENIREGEDIAGPLERSGLFPPILLHMISVGEKSGNLEDMLMKVSETYDSEVNTSIQKLTSLVEPVLILTMGLVVGFIVISILLPMFELNQMVG